MEAEAGFSHIAPPIFDGENYQIWAVRMEAYLEALDVWEAVEEADFQVPALPDNPTMAQLKYHKERKKKEDKSKGHSICCCLTFNFHQNYDFGISKCHLELPSSRVSR